MRWLVVAFPSILIIASMMVHITYQIPSGDEGEEREYYTGEPRDYYGSGTGLVFAQHIPSGLLSVDLDSLDLPDFSELPVYTLDPPDLWKRQDAVDYLANFSYDVSSYSYYSCDDYVKTHVFHKGQVSISVNLNGAIHYDDQTPVPASSPTNMTREEAIAAAMGYLENHTGTPSGARMEVHASMMGDSTGEYVVKITIHLHRTHDGFDFAISGGKANHIIIEMDARSGKVEWFVYAWTDLVRTDTIDAGELDDIGAVVERYVDWHNELMEDRLGTDSSVVNVTGVSIEYRPPYGSSMGDMYEGSPRYVYLPHLRIDVGEGYACLSPLVPYEVE